MSLDRRTAAVSLILLLAVFVISGVLFATLVRKSFRQVETSHVSDHIESVRYALQDRISQLDHVAADYASWNLTYDFMKTRNPHYEVSELNDESLQSLNVHAFLLVDLQGQIALLKVVGERPRTLNAEQLQSIVTGSTALSRNSVEGGITGVVASGGAPFLVSIRPILNSRNEGPSRGALVMARLIDDDLLKEINTLTQSGLKVVSLSKAQHGPLNELFGSSGDSYTFDFEPEWSRAYILLRDLNSRPAAALEISLSRESWLRGDSAQKAALVLMLTTILLFAVVGLVLLRFGVFSRIVSLAALTADVHRTGDFTRHSSICGEDEIGTLASSINAMLSKLKDAQDQLAEAREHLRNDSSHDALTGVLNRRAGFEALERELARCRRERRPLALFVLDFDNFKSINDSFGHAAGDMVLSESSKVLINSLRPFDTLFRSGGDEFLIIAPGITLFDAMHIGDRILKRLRSTAMDWNGTELRVTGTMGVACSSRELSPDELVTLADRALYRAKDKGRDCIECEDFSADGVIRSVQMNPQPFTQRPL